MTAVVCIADGGGMTFNKRRVSRDKAVIKDLEVIACDEVLFVSEYSERLFSDSTLSLIAVSDPLESAKDGDIAFIENISLHPHRKKITRLIIYKWNRAYPCDFSLDIDPRVEKMRLLSSIDFVGNTHEKITREIWSR